MFHTGFGNKVTFLVKPYSTRKSLASSVPLRIQFTFHKIGQCSSLAIERALKNGRCPWSELVFGGIYFLSGSNRQYFVLYFNFWARLSGDRSPNSSQEMAWIVDPRCLRRPSEGWSCGHCVCWAGICWRMRSSAAGMEFRERVKIGPVSLDFLLLTWRPHARFFTW
jgi:hypothetical protein